MTYKKPTDLWTRTDLALRWQVSTMTLKRYEKAGLLPYMKIGKGVRYRLCDIEQFEKEARVGGKSI